MWALLIVVILRISRLIAVTTALEALAAFWLALMAFPRAAEEGDV